MRREPHKTKDGLKVWLDRPEVDLFIQQAKTPSATLSRRGESLLPREISPSGG